MKTTDIQALEVLQFFAFGHLPAHLQAVSKPFSDAAHDLAALAPEVLKLTTNRLEETTTKILSDLRRFIETLPCNPEATWALVEVNGAQDHAANGHGIGMVLRGILKAKDCAVRSLIYKHPEQG